ncbi:MAG: hypothetical protein ACFFDN_16965, partial [Candidatus Hodarchaeota archaeon]
MVQVLEKQYYKTVSIRESKDIREIREALDEILYVPDEQLKPKVIEELCNYLQTKFSNPDYKLKVFIAYDGYEIYGFVTVQIDPYYSSYSRKCGTFGWLYAATIDVCRELIRQCEKFIKENKIRKLRGPINFPKNLGGIGIQCSGFQEQMLYGVSFSDPTSNILEYLNSLGYKNESEYSCVYVAQKIWNKGKKIDKDITFRFFSLKELYDYAKEIQNLANNSFHDILPDSSGRNRIYEFFEAFSKIPKSFYKVPTFNPLEYSEIPQFIEVWETHDLNKTEPYAPMAFDKHKGELVGILLGLPDLYESWIGNLITRCNVDTAMVKKEYYGKGIFSALNNLGQLNCSFYGVTY